MSWARASVSGAMWGRSYAIGVYSSADYNVSSEALAEAERVRVSQLDPPGRLYLPINAVIRLSPSETHPVDFSPGTLIPYSSLSAEDSARDCGTHGFDVQPEVHVLGGALPLGHFSRTAATLGQCCVLCKLNSRCAALVYKVKTQTCDFKSSTIRARLVSMRGGKLPFSDTVVGIFSDATVPEGSWVAWRFEPDTNTGRT